MSDYYNENKLKMIVRKVQSGKTYILAEDIENDKTDTIHIIFTMNTILATEQLLVRLPTNNIIVCNSSNKHTKTDTFQYYHAKNCEEIMNYLIEEPNIKCIVMCSNDNKMAKLMPKLFTKFNRDIYLQNKKIKIHVDEAHQYINLIKSDDTVRSWYDTTNVSEIILYSASPLNLWDQSKNWKNDKPSIFYSIYVIDVEAERNIINVSTYFGVKDLDCTNINKDSIENIIMCANLSCKIPDNVISIFRKHSLKHKQSIGKQFSYNFYLESDKLSPLLGKEYEYLCYIKVILPELIVNKDIFSYTFIPGYSRCVTHYMICELIIAIYPNSNIIIINGQFMGLYINADNIIEYSDDLNDGVELYEPAQKIECLIRGRRNKPTFVTGFMCLNMSVTLINESLGNFDNSVMCHSHCSIEMVYQLSRFGFNYTNWNENSISKIKRTRFFSINDETVQIARTYEETVEKINNLSGKQVTLNNINGISETTDCFNDNEEKNIKIQLFKYLDEVDMQEYKVYLNNENTEAEMWEKAKTFYKNKKDKNCQNRSIPTKKGEFYEWGLSSNTKIMHKNDMTNKLISWRYSYNWDSNYCLNNSTTYARIYVGYDNINNPTEYSIFVRYCVLNNCEEVTNLLQQLQNLKKTKKELANNPLNNNDATNINSDRILKDKQEFRYTSKFKVVTKFIYNALKNTFKIEDDIIEHETLGSVIACIQGTSYRQNAWDHCEYKENNKWHSTKKIKKV